MSDRSLSIPVNNQESTFVYFLTAALGQLKRFQAHLVSISTSATISS
jgi:hypothetical protein